VTRIETNINVSKLRLRLLYLESEAFISTRITINNRRDDKRSQSHTSCYYLRIENAEGNVLIAVYLFIYLYACYSQKKKSFKPNRMKFGGMIGYYPGTI